MFDHNSENTQHNGHYESHETYEIEPPIPLLDSEPTSEIFPIEELGPILSPAAIAMEKGIQAPSALICQSLLVATSLVAQAHVNVSMDGRIYPVSLFALTIGCSGERKSAVDSQVLLPHREHEKRKIIESESKRIAYEREFEIWTSERRKLMAGSANASKSAKLESLGSPPEAPPSEVMLVDEPTYEALVKLYSSGAPSLGLFSDEGGRLLGGHAMNKDNELKTLSSFSSLWDGKPISRARAGDGTTKLYERRLSVHLMCQPVVANLLLRSSLASGQGFVARFLIVAPNSRIGSRPYQHIDLGSDPDILQYRRRIAELLEMEPPFDGSKKNPKPRNLTLSAEAKALWVVFHDWVEKRIDRSGDLFCVGGFACKLAEQALRIAGTLSFLKDPQSSEICSRVMSSSLALTQFYLGEAVRLAKASLVEEEIKQAQQLLEYCQKYEVVYAPEIYRSAPMRGKKVIMPLMAILEDHRHVIRIDGGMPLTDAKGRLVRRETVWRVAK